MRLPQAVAGRATIIIDSGFMRGTDVVKAMALGADLVGVGRMAAFALAAGGEEGVVKFVRPQSSHLLNLLLALRFD